MPYDQAMDPTLSLAPMQPVQPLPRSAAFLQAIQNPGSSILPPSPGLPGMPTSGREERLAKRQAVDPSFQYTLNAPPTPYSFTEKNIYAPAEAGVRQGMQTLFHLTGDYPMAASAGRDVERASRPFAEDQARFSGPDVMSRIAEDPVEAAKALVLRGGVQSLASMGTVGLPLAIPAVAAGPAGIAAATGLVSGATEYSGTVMDLLREQGIDPNNDVDLASALSDPLIMDGVRKSALARAIPIGVVDAASAGLLGSLFKKPVGAVAKPTLVQVLKGLGLEMAQGGAGEFAGQVSQGVVEGDPTKRLALAPVVGEMAGELGPGAATVATTAARQGAHAIETLPERRDIQNLQKEVLGQTAPLPDHLKYGYEESNEPLPPVEGQVALPPDPVNETQTLEPFNETSEGAPPLIVNGVEIANPDVGTLPHELALAGVDKPAPFDGGSSTVGMAPELETEGQPTLTEEAAPPPPVTPPPSTPEQPRPTPPQVPRMSLRNEDMGKTLERTFNHIDSYSPGVKKQFEASRAQAAKEGMLTPEKATEIATRVENDLNKGKAPSLTESEVVSLATEAARLAEEGDAAAEAGDMDRHEALFSQFQKIKLASNYGGRGQARAFNLRKMEFTDYGNLTNVKFEMQKARGKALTPEQESKARVTVKKYKEAKKKAQEAAVKSQERQTAAEVSSELGRVIDAKKKRQKSGKGLKEGMSPEARTAELKRVNDAVIDKKATEARKLLDGGCDVLGGGTFK